MVKGEIKRAAKEWLFVAAMFGLILLSGVIEKKDEIDQRAMICKSAAYALENNLDC